MALVRVGAANSGTTGNNGNDATVNLSGFGLQEGDVVYGVASFRGTTDLTMAMTTSGYTTLADLYADDDNDINLGVFRKVMGATPDASAVFENPGSVAGDHLTAIAEVWRGADTTTPEDAATTTATGINSAIPDHAAITTVTDGAVVLILAGSSIGDSTVTPPTGYSNSSARAGTTTNVAVASKAIATAAAEDPGAWVGWNTATDRAWAAVTVAIRPATAPTFQAAWARGSNVVIVGAA